jgi:hypothetical protein
MVSVKVEVTTHNWRQTLKIQCDLLGIKNVSHQLGVSYNYVRQVLKGTYPANARMLEELVAKHLQPIKPITPTDNWIEILRDACEKYTIAKVAKYLNVAHSTLNYVLSGTYPHINRTKLNVKVCYLIGTKLEDVDRLSLHIKTTPKQKDIEPGGRVFLGLIDFIFCEEWVTRSQVKNLLYLGEPYTEHRISRQFNQSIEEGLFKTKEEIIKVKGNLPQQIIYYGLACNCFSPGMLECCQDCRLGKRIIELDRLSGAVDDE